MQPSSSVYQPLLQRKECHWPMSKRVVEPMKYQINKSNRIQICVIIQKDNIIFPLNENQEALYNNIIF